MTKCDIKNCEKEMESFDPTNYRKDGVLAIVNGKAFIICMECAKGFGFVNL